MFWNILKTLATCVFIAYVGYDESAKEKLFVKKVIVLKNYSNFSKVTVIYVVAMMNIDGVVICIIQVTRSKKIEHFANQLFSISFRESLLIKFQKESMKYSLILFSIFTFVSSVQIIGAMKISFLTIFSTFIFLYPNFVLISFVSFVKFFGIFISISLENFQYGLSYITTENKLKNDLAQSKKYHDIFEWVESFKKIFKNQLTLVACYCSSVMVLNVNSGIYS